MLLVTFFDVYFSVNRFLENPFAFLKTYIKMRNLEMFHLQHSQKQLSKFGQLVR
jgi:hypothetical protein